MIRCERHNLSGTCGVQLAYQFQDRIDAYATMPTLRPSWHRAPNPADGLDRVGLGGGAGWLCAGFIRYGATKQAYEILAKRYKIVLQTPVRRNSNSGNDFIFVVYDTQPLKGPRPRWVGQRSGAPKPQALIEWEKAAPKPVDNSAHKWPWN